MLQIYYIYIQFHKTVTCLLCSMTKIKRYCKSVNTPKEKRKNVKKYIYIILLLGFSGVINSACLKLLRFYYCVHNEPLKNDFILTFRCQIAFMAFVSRRSILCVWCL